MKAPVWDPARAVVAMRLELIAEHGGLAGPPRIARLEAALARPQQQFSYATPPPSLERLAAAYGYTLARNHCFPDGNAANTMLASGDLTEEQLADWIAAHATARK
jgi:death on curing protein